MQRSTRDRFEELFGQEWYNALEELLESRYWKELGNKVAVERKHYTIYPSKYDGLIFKAFRTTPLSKVKVVILGQDPYHDDSYDGYAFSNKGKTSGLSPSLRNIFKEVENDVYDGLKVDQDPDLERWAEQGVLLINTAHTVRKGEPGSHISDWIPFTMKVVNTLLTKKEKLVWILWGKKAQNVVNVNRGMEITKGKHLFIQSAHPSPFSAHMGFFDSKPFSQTNKYLEDERIQQITW